MHQVEATGVQFLTYLLSQAVGHILQDDILQAEAIVALFDQRPPPQSQQCLHQHHARTRLQHVFQQLIQVDRFALNGQPKENFQLKRGQPLELSIQQLRNGRGHQAAGLQVGADLVIEHFMDGVGYQLQGQRVSRVARHQCLPLF